MSHSKAVLRMVPMSRHPHGLTKRQEALRSLSYSILFTADRYMGPEVGTEDLILERCGLVHSPLKSRVDMFVAKRWHGLDQCMAPPKLHVMC